MRVFPRAMLLALAAAALVGGGTAALLRTCGPFTDVAGLNFWITLEATSSPVFDALVL